MLKREEKRSDEYTKIAVSVANAHEKMRSVAPGAAYVFANTLHFAAPLLEDKSATLEQKKAALDKEMRGAITARSYLADGGVGILAMRFLALMLEAEPGHGMGWLMLSASYGDIAKHGRAYRELNALDEQPPKNPQVRSVLRGASCVADLIRTIRAEGASLGEDPSDAVNASLALIDMREEAESDEFHRVVGLLEAILGKPVY